MFHSVLSVSFALSCLALAATPARANGNPARDPENICQQNDCQTFETINSKLILVAENEIQDDSLSGQVSPSDQLRTDIEALIIQYKDDAEGLKSELATYLTSSSDPLAATNVLLDILNDPQNEDVSQALNDNADLIEAAGTAIGTAIATISLADPDTAAAIETAISLQTNTALKQAVAQGKADQNKKYTQNTNNQQQGNQDSTPEQSTSPH